LQLDATLSDLKKAHNALETQQSANSQLRSDKVALEDRVARLAKSLEETTSRLSSEVDVASEMKSQLAELKLEYIAAGDKLEAEQLHIRELQVDLRNMESALNAVSHDKKAAQMENAQLNSQLEASQKAVLAAQAAEQDVLSDLIAHQEAAADLRAQIGALEEQLQEAKAVAISQEQVGHLQLPELVDALYLVHV
jgi:chromosome segregation ATPase